MPANPAIVMELGVNGLGVVRSLAQMNVDVIGVYTEDGPGCHSRYCRAVSLPKISVREEEYKSRLVDLCRSLPAKPVLFPTSDETVSFVSKYRRELKEVSLFSLPDAEVLDDVLNKDGTKDLALACGIRIPQTYTVDSLHALARLSDRVRYPLLFKPRDTFSVRLPKNEKNLLFNDGKELLGFFTAFPEYVSLGVLQEVVSGGDGFIFICAGYFNAEHEPVALYTGRKIRQYLPDYGVTCCGESVYVPEVAGMTIDFMKKARYRGLAAIEFVQDRQTGDFYFLEINARSYYHNALFLSCGVNLPQAAYLDITGQLRTSDLMPRQKEGIVWLDFTRDLSSFLIKKGKKELSLAEWLRSIVRARSFAVFDPRDIKPFLYSTRILCGLMNSRLKRTIGLASRPSPPSPEPGRR